MSNLYNSLNTNTIKNMQLDAGVLVLGDINVTAFAGLGGTTPIGATKGATTFSAVPEMRNIFEGLDGCRGFYKGGTVIDQWDVTLKTTISEMTKENISKVLNTSVSNAQQVGSSKPFEELTHKDEIATEDYIGVISWVGTMAGSTEPMIIKLYNVLNMNGFTITAEDKNSGTVEVEFRAHMDLSRPSDRLFKIYVPKNREALASERLEFKEVEIDLEKVAEATK